MDGTGLALYDSPLLGMVLETALGSQGTRGQLAGLCVCSGVLQAELTAVRARDRTMGMAR